ncbi:High-mobility group box 6 [Hibiscus syriacus]|uniref:High-mobility group box 6 n=1 Tax=Hibiscus syriacus TaxID=106335 RepID=A0A6A2WYZ6_HIBSY|nr:High-mobility group box 6 [Hibiscus syriacus]
MLEVFPLALAAGCSEVDRAALLGFKAKILKDSTDNLSSWIGRDCCGGDWKGVECNPAGRVNTLALQRPVRDSTLYMKGTSSSSLGGSPVLGSVGHQWDEAYHSFNLLSGSIPEILRLFHNTTFTDLSNNLLSGNLPVSMFNLVTLSDLSLSHNQLTGSIPDQVGNLKSLNSLSLSHNKLIDPIPASISRLQKLWSLNLSRNGFSNLLPAISSKGIPSLLSIDLSYNNLSLGTVPKWIINRQLSDVNLAGCKPGGAFSNLQKLKLSNNQLKFDLSELMVPDRISTINLHSNQVLGSLSSIFNNRTSSFLEVIDVSNNLISGTVPEFTEGLSLKVLNIGGNKIAGQVPGSILNIVEPERLDVLRNLITGTIPASLGQPVKLQRLDVSINQLAGKIPASLLGIKSMRHANFRANRLCEEIPQGRPYNIFPASGLCL